jgi:hypothetical protein
LFLCFQQLFHLFLCFQQYKSTCSSIDCSSKFDQQYHLHPAAPTMAQKFLYQTVPYHLRPKHKSSCSSTNHVSVLNHVSSLELTYCNTLLYVLHNFYHGTQTVHGIHFCTGTCCLLCKLVPWTCKNKMHPFWLFLFNFFEDVLWTEAPNIGSDWISLKVLFDSSIADPGAVAIDPGPGIWDRKTPDPGFGLCTWRAGFSWPRFV